MSIKETEKIKLKKLEEKTKKEIKLINLKITEESLKDWNIADIISIIAGETYNNKTMNFNLKFYLVNKNYEDFADFTGEELELKIHKVLTSGAGGKGDIEFWLKRGKKLKDKWKEEKVKENE